MKLENCSCDREIPCRSGRGYTITGRALRSVPFFAGSLLLQHQSTLLPDEPFRLLGNHRENPRQLDLHAHGVLRHVQVSRDILAHGADAKIHPVAGPAAFDGSDLVAELRLHLADAML